MTRLRLLSGALYGLIVGFGFWLIWIASNHSHAFTPTFALIGFAAAFGHFTGSSDEWKRKWNGNKK